MSAQRKGRRRRSYKKVVLSQSGRRDVWLVAAGRLVFLLGTACVLVIVAGVIVQRQLTHAAVAALAVGVVFAGAGAFFEIAYGGVAARREEKDVRHRLLESVFGSVQLPTHQEEDFDSARTIQLMTDNAERLTEYRQTYFGATVAAIAAPFLTLAYVAIAYDAVVGLALMALCPLIPYLISVFKKFFRQTSANSRSERGKLAGEYLDAIRNLVTIRLLGAGPRVEKHLREQGEKNRGAIMKLLAGNQIVIIVMDGLFSLLLICAAALLTVIRYHAGALTMSESIAIMLLTSLLIEPLVQVAGFFYVGMGGMAAERAIGRYLRTHPIPHAHSTRHISPASGGISVENVTFDYGRGEVLHGVSLEVPAGSKVAIVGRSGGGKTTLLSILRGSLPIQGGHIKIGGRNIADLQVPDIRALTATVSQNTWLFTGTVADNVRIAAPEASEEEIWDALRRVHVADDVAAMPQGLYTDVGEQGVLVSGGQAQRLSLARALLSGRKILLLDEPTSQVDRESERAIIEAIKGFGPEWTLLIVTHRRALLEVADAAYEMKHGELHPMELSEGALR